MSEDELTPHRLNIYLPQDRLRALAKGEALPERSRGAAIFADISGFTPLTEKLTQELGPRRGIEELTQRINSVYEILISNIERFGGSVIDFAGDAATCWFDEQDGNATTRAVSCAQAMQNSMQAFINLALKIAITSGPARRFVIGDPNIQLIDILAGATIERLATGEHLAKQGEIIVDEESTHRLVKLIQVQEWRTAGTQERFAILGPLAVQAVASSIETRPTHIPVGILKPWLLPIVYERELSEHGAFLTELRPTVPVFLRFTGIDYDTDELAQEKLDTFIRRVQAILTRYGGALLQITIGDKGSYLYASFGAPVAHEDDAFRAVKAAVELRQLSEELRFLQPIQIGISRGTMRTGAYGGKTRHTYGALGDDTNLAARLMITAEPGEILISGKVHNLVAEAFSCQPRPPLPIKGKAEPLPIFVVTGVRSARAIRLEEPSYPLPMMGRAAELALIDEKLAFALESHGQIIGIIAEAGLGKSRLIAEIIRLARQRRFTGYGGACESSGTNTAYFVWRPIWQAFFNIDSAAPLRRQIRNLEGEVKDYVPTKIQALPVLSPLLDLPIEDNDFTRTLAPEVRRDVLTVLLEDCLKFAAREEPLLLVLEDIHWIDPLSYDLLEKLARVCANLPICIVLAYRPPEVARLQMQGVEALPHFTKLELQNLTTAESEQLVRAKLAQLFPERTTNLPKAVIAELISRAEGNPFFIEELLNYLRDRGLNPFEVPVQPLELPSSLHVLILSRIDQLIESQKITLKTASIIGRLFNLDWLLGYYPQLGEEDRVKADLAELSRLDLTPLDTPEPDLAYIFKHIVTHQVAYESIAYGMRLRLHEQLARFIEARGADRYLDLLAFHYGNSENILKQQEYFQKAADAARAVYNNDAALAYYERLLPLLTEPQALIEVQMNRGGILQLMGKWAEAETAYLAALTHSQEIHSAETLARGQKALGTLFRLRGDYGAALDWLERARSAQEALGNDLELAKVLTEMGRVLEQKGSYTRAREYLESGLLLAHQHPDRAITANILLALGHVAADQGNYTEARSFYSDSLELWRELGEKQGIATTLNNLGLIATSQGDYTTAQALNKESLALRREIGDKQGVAISLGNLGRVAFEQGDYAASQLFLEEGLALSREIGDQRGILMSLINLGVRIQNQSEPAKARPYHEESLVLARELEIPSAVAVSLTNLGMVAAEQADYVTARAYYEECLVISRQIGDKDIMASTLLNLGYVSYEQQDDPNALVIIRQSLDLFKEMNARAGIIYCLVGLAAVIARSGEPRTAVQLAAAAENMRSSIQLALAPDGSRLYEQTLSTAHLSLSATEFNTEWEAGMKLTLEEALKLAHEHG